MKIVQKIWRISLLRIEKLRLISDYMYYLFASSYQLLRKHKSSLKFTSLESMISRTLYLAYGSSANKRKRKKSLWNFSFKVDSVHTPE